MTRILRAVSCGESANVAQITYYAVRFQIASARICDVELNKRMRIWRSSAVHLRLRRAFSDTTTHVIRELNTYISRVASRGVCRISRLISYINSILKFFIDP